MAAVLIAVLPAAVLGVLTAVQFTQFLTARHEDQMSGTANAMARALDRHIAAVTLAVAAMVRDGGALRADAEAERAPVAVLLKGLGVTGALWREEGGELVARNLAAGAVDRAPVALRAAAERVASSGRVEMAAARLAQTADDSSDDATDRPVSLVVLSPLGHGESQFGVLQVAFGPRLIGEWLALDATWLVATVRLVSPEGRVAGRPSADDQVASPSVAQMMSRWQALARSPANQVVPITARDGTPHLFVAAELPAASGWRIVLIQRSPIRVLTWLVPLVAFVAVVALSLTVALAAAARLGSRLTRPLAALTADAGGLAAHGELAQVAGGGSGVAEFDDLHASLRRSTAVLRRRAAAERMALTEARTGHELLTSVVTATKDLIYVKNLDLRLVLANRATLSVGGLQRDEWQVLGCGIDALLPLEAALQEEALDRRVLAGGEGGSMRLEWPRLDGEIRSFMLRKSLWRDVTGRITGVVTVAHDVTEQRAAEARLASVQADLLRVSRLSAMGAMASGLAHELNQPLAAAANFLNAASRLLGGSGERRADTRNDRTVRAAVIDASEQILRAGAIVRRLRAFIARGEADLRSDDVGDVIRETCELARVDGATRSAELVIREPGCGEMVLLDRTQLQQVLLNLIRNAAEALGATERGRIEIACIRLTGGDVRITVADNGPGLAPEVVQRLFHPFVSTKADGMGVGLAICRTIIEGHGGRLSAEANDGGGTVFTIVLPATRSVQDVAAHAA